MTLTKTLSLWMLAAAAFAQTWSMETSNSNASLRGVHAVDAKTVWASGSGATYLLTTDGGATWTAGKAPGAERSDFRAVWAFDARTAFLVSIGSADASKIYKTTDGGANWKLLFTNPDKEGFFDGIACWNRERCIVAGDPVDGHTVILTTSDGGEHWAKQNTASVAGKEGAFAASNSSLAILPNGQVWLGTTLAKVLHSADYGVTWTAAQTPVRVDSGNAGIFSVYFLDAQRGIAVGGDYSKAADNKDNIAMTSDGGKTWKAAGEARPAGFRSAVVYVPSKKAWIAAGPSGSDISTDGGASWRNFDTANLNAVSFAPDGSGWAVGPRGKIAKIEWK
jgi:photosystem II stability/assembly factor-like uncharacterized protein